MGRLAQSDGRRPGDHTSKEDPTRLAFEAGNSAFMINYPFVYPSAKENAPGRLQGDGGGQVPARSTRASPSEPPLGGINIGVSRVLQEHRTLAFEAIKCLVQPENQLATATRRRPAAGARGPLRHEGDREGLSRLRRPDPPVDRGRRAAAVGVARLPGPLAGDPATRCTRPPTSTPTNPSRPTTSCATTSSRPSTGRGCCERERGDLQRPSARRQRKAQGHRPHRAPSASSAGCCARRR